MERICIIGGSGTGKTTLSENLAKELHIPVFHIDGINYLKNWEIRDKRERDQEILKKIEQPKWIMQKGTHPNCI